MNTGKALTDTGSLCTGEQYLRIFHQKPTAPYGLYKWQYVRGTWGRKHLFPSILYTDFVGGFRQSRRCPYRQNLSRSIPCCSKDEHQVTYGHHWIDYRRSRWQCNAANPNSLHV